MSLFLGAGKGTLLLIVLSSLDWTKSKICNTFFFTYRPKKDTDEFQTSFLENMGLQNNNQVQLTTKNKNPEIPNNYNLKCNCCESVFRKSWELKKHLDQMHSQKLTPLKSANVTPENIILYKRHIGKVIHTMYRSYRTMYLQSY